MKKNKIIIRSLLSMLLVGLLLLISYEMIHIYGASNQYKFELPKYGSNINAGIDKSQVRKIKFRELIQLDGWAYINNYNADEQRKYIVLYSESNQYIFGTNKVIRNDLPAALNNTDDHLESAGFSSLIDMTNVKSGSYRIGYFIENKNQRELTLSNIIVNKIDNEITFKESMNKQQSTKIEKANENIKASIEEISNENGVIKIKGWGYLEGISSQGNEISIVLKGNNETLIYDTQSQIRHDVTKYFGGKVDLDHSGFVFKISRDDIKKGNYQIGIYIKNGQSRGLYWSKESIGE
ncbi:hypothetical protein EJP82_21820 [Paenibacillus anaericanus]|uniref:Uncharacterized protein n=1 Tax=Paenibacillus anaericanus TaxID=170367 RepID=A0A433Y3Z5_9BACL|nr:hypothetical protein [Paenibacillus anaericanus]RUT42871.1 hypothetical protein EJP82_21820 [Paenibacillus anaericanus]